MKKTVQRSLALVLFLLMLLALPAMAGEAPIYTDEADALNSLGLFQGTGNGYELERAPTRAEALVLLVRLLGKEAEAKAYAGDCPLGDVAGRWMAPYVGWAYAQGITKGTSDSAFTPDAYADARMFSTFVLRALGYTEEAGDFIYADAVAKAGTVGIEASAGYAAGDFSRDDCVHICYQALSALRKGSAETLIEKLVADGAVDAAAAEALNLRSPADQTGGADAITVACVGDSLTFGLMSDDPATQSYPAVMATLREGGYRFVTENYGLSGACVDPDDSYFFALPYDASAEYAASILTQADVVLLMLGTNDAFWSPHLDIFEENYSKLIRTYIELPQKPTVIAVLPPHLYFTMEGMDTGIYDTNIANVVQYEKNVAEALGLPVIDAYSFNADSPELFVDGIHFTVEGYSLLAQEIYSQLCAILDGMN